MANNLADGPHEILVTNVGTRNGTVLDFDFAVVTSSINPNAETTGNSTNSSTTGSATSLTGSATSLTGSTTVLAGASTANPTDKTTSFSSDSDAGPIAGSVIGGLVGLALFALLAWFLLRRRKSKRDYMEPSAEPMDLSGDEVKPYPHGSPEAAYAVAAGPSVGLGSSPNTWGRSSSPSAREMDHTSTPFLTAVPPPPASSATSFSRSDYPSSPVNSASPIHEYAPYVNPFTGSGGPRSTSDRQSSTYTPAASFTGTRSGATPSSIAPTPSPATPPRGSAKGARMVLPFTARQPAASSATSTNYSSPARMYRDGREFDMGPAIHHDGPDGPLPPDYQQATEPLPGQRPPSGPS